MSTYRDRISVYQTEYIEYRDVSFLKELIGQKENSVLEIPCGVGRLALHLASVASRYTISDMEVRMVQTAQDRLAKEGRLNHVTSFVGDMCTIDPEEVYDWIIVPREALQLLPPDSARCAIANLCQLLRRSNGRLIIDLTSFSIAGDPDYYYPANIARAWHNNWSRVDQSGSLLTRWSQQNESQDRVEFSFRYEWGSEYHDRTNFNSQMTLYKYGNDFMIASIPDGFSIYNSYGDYNKSPWKEGSGRMIFIIGPSK